VEEKYGKDQNESDEESSSDETEDEDGFLATEDLDAQISATLQAIRSKDPRVYDSKVTFYNPEDANTAGEKKNKKDKPVYLTDYHREKILRGDAGQSDDEEEEEAPRTYNQEQDALKKSIVSEMNAAQAEDSDSDDDTFMKRKEPTAAKLDSNGIHASRAPALKITDRDVEDADRDPESYLSNFMSSRAWLPGDEGSRWKAFESDEGEEDDEAEAFEQAYNMRFEDPEKSNQVLKSYSRDLTASRSVRREEKSGRKRQRELERERKEEEKRQRKAEKAQLRKIKLEEAEERLRKVKHAAGATGKELHDQDWIKFLDDAWDNEKWEEEMNRRFGDEYYGLDDADFEGNEEEGGDDDEEDGQRKSKKSKRPKKPKWDDDIDIKDIIPDFDEENAKPNITLSDDDQGDGNEDEDEDDEAPAPKKRKAADHKRERIESQKAARKDRAKLEALIDSKLQLTNHDLLDKATDAGASSSASASASVSGPFRYRETSPQAFGMTARDILLAPSDAALNDFAGLKKLASFRDEQKKRRDRKRLSKKAHLRQWRRDNFGRDFERTGPTYGFEKFADQDEAAAGIVAADDRTDGDAADGLRKKRKRSKGKGIASTS
jgi:protein KRI1